MPRATNSTSKEQIRRSRMRALSRFAGGVESVQHLARRPMRQQWLVVEAFFTLWTAKVMLLGLPFERFRRLLQRPVRHPDNAPVERLGEVVWAVTRVSRCWSGKLTCLPQAIAVHSILARRHWDSRLEIGVGKNAAGEFEAHAWVEQDGHVIIGQLPDLERFTRLRERDPLK